MLTWRLTESTEKPLDIDIVSSKSVVYFHRDIVEKEATDENSSTMYQYLEAMVNKLDYEKNKSLYEAELSIIEIEQAITEMDLKNIETEQAITDLDLRIMEVELK